MTKLKKFFLKEISSDRVEIIGNIYKNLEIIGKKL